MTKKRMQALRVPLRDAESLRRLLREQHLLRENVSILKEGTSVYFPIIGVIKDIPNCSIVSKTFEVKVKPPRWYKDLLKIPKKLKGDLPTSYDVVGSIILIKIPPTLYTYRMQIGHALLLTHRNVRTVCSVDPVVGELRLRNVEIIAGEPKTMTIHTEYGLSYHVDVAATYFSTRLASERRRVTDQVKPGETVVDLFAGVAPFSIMIARYAKPKVVYAIDKNSEAITLAVKNVTLNRVLDIVEVIHADAKDAKTVIPTEADRIIMNLPFSASAFLTVALSIAAPRCTLHYYDILHEDNIDERISALKNIGSVQGYRLTVGSVHKIKSYAPREFYIGLDITATKHADVA
jgi:tRNA (guanine37-N1)-methyltransferase